MKTPFSFYSNQIQDFIKERIEYALKQGDYDNIRLLSECIILLQKTFDLPPYSSSSSSSPISSPAAPTEHYEEDEEEEDNDEFEEEELVGEAEDLEENLEENLEEDLDHIDKRHYGIDWVVRSRFMGSKSGEKERITLLNYFTELLFKHHAIKPGLPFSVKQLMRIYSTYYDMSSFNDRERPSRPGTPRSRFVISEMLYRLRDIEYTDKKDKNPHSRHHLVTEKGYEKLKEYYETNVLKSNSSKKEVRESENKNEEEEESQDQGNLVPFVPSKPYSENHHRRGSNMGWGS